MDTINFLWDKTLALVFNAVVIIAVSVITGLTAGWAVAVIIAAGWTAAMVVYCAVSYILIKKRIARIQKTAHGLTDKFLLSEVVPAPYKLEDRLYYELMLLQGKAAIEKVTVTQKEQADYYDYLEGWVHEIKTPIAAIGLICENNQGDAFREISRQAGLINNYAEQVLYEARSGRPEKDLMIQETELSGAVRVLLKENKRLLIDAGVTVTSAADGVVLTDPKWLEFILKQMLYNCVQYKAEKDAQIKITAKALDGGNLGLSVWDNGAGILASELPRIFDKGFTGTNGRRNKKSTGLGLYLCKKLCDALDVSVTVESDPGKFTEFLLIFKKAPKGNLTKL